MRITEKQLRRIIREVCDLEEIDDRHDFDSNKPADLRFNARRGLWVVRDLDSGKTVYNNSSKRDAEDWAVLNSYDVGMDL